MHSSVCVCVCVCRWCLSQLEKESGKGAISAQLALIAYTLFLVGRSALWNDQMLRPGPPCTGPIRRRRRRRCCCSGPGLRSQTETGTDKRDREYIYRCHYVSLRSLCWSLPHLVALSLLLLLLNIRLIQYRCLSVALPMCRLFHLTLFSESIFSPTVYFTYSDSMLFKALSHECCFLFLPFSPWIVLSSSSFLA